MLKKIKEFLFILFNEDKIEEASKAQPIAQPSLYKHQHEDNEDIMLFVRLVNKANKDKQLTSERV